MLMCLCYTIIKVLVIINAEILTSEVLTPMWVRLFGTINHEYPLHANVFIFSINQF